MIKMFDPFLTWAARRYQAAVATELKKYGLRYEDLYDPLLNMVRPTAQHAFTHVIPIQLSPVLAFAAFSSNQHLLLSPSNQLSVIKCWLPNDSSRLVICFRTLMRLFTGCHKMLWMPVCSA